MWILDKAKYKHVSPRLFSGPNIQILSEGFSCLLLILLLLYPPHCSRQHCLYLGVQQQVSGPQAELCQHPQMSLHLWHLSAGENMKNHTAIATYKLFLSGAPQKGNKYIEKFALLVQLDDTRWCFKQILLQWLQMTAIIWVWLHLFSSQKEMVLRMWQRQALQFSTWFDETAQTFDLENLTQNRPGSLGQT